MKPLLTILIAALIALSGTAVAFAKEQTDAAPTTSEASVQDNSSGEAKHPLLSAEQSEASEAAKNDEKEVIDGNFKSKDKKFKLYIFDNGKTAYADIIKYIGEDDFPRATRLRKLTDIRFVRFAQRLFQSSKL